MSNSNRQQVQLNATALAELQSLRAENEKLRRASLSSSNDSFFAQVEEHRRQRRIDELEEDLEEDPWCKTRRQKLVGVHVLSFMTGLSCFMYGLYLIVFEAGLRRGNTFVPLVFSVQQCRNATHFQKLVPLQLLRQSNLIDVVKLIDRAP